MVEVGIRELKAHLSGWVRRVHSDGETVAITDRGRIVAVLAPAAIAATTPEIPALHDRVRARGGRPAVEQGWPVELPAVSMELRAVDAQALLADLRGER